MNGCKGPHGLHDERQRRSWQNPESILADIGLRPGSTFLDIGCGEGFFAIPAARLVGESGEVWGLEIDSELIRRLKERAEGEGLRHLKLVAGKAEEVILCEGCADIVFFGIVLHDFEDPAKVLVNARRMLKPTGRLINLDWKKEAMPFGPPLRIRFSEDHAVELIEKAGFRVEVVKQAPPYHYIIVAEP